jgi:hypothetical protein
MQQDTRKGAWRFDTLWKLPTHMVGSTSVTDNNWPGSKVMDELEFRNYIQAWCGGAHHVSHEHQKC